MSKSRSSHSEGKKEEYIACEEVTVLPTPHQQVNQMSGSAASTESKKNLSTSYLNNENGDQLRISSGPGAIYEDQTVSSTSSVTPVKSESKIVKFDQSQEEKNISSGKNARLFTPPEKQSSQRNSITKNQTDTTTATNNSTSSNVLKPDTINSKYASSSSHVFSFKKTKKPKEHSADHPKKNNCVIF